MDEQMMTDFIMQNAGLLCAIYVPLVVFGIVCYWKLFKKAGEPGWAILIPIYNVVVLMRVAKMSLWWLLLLLGCFIPFIGAGFSIAFGVIQAIKLAQAFRKGTGFALGLFFLSFIFVAILAFGSAKHIDAPEA